MYYCTILSTDGKVRIKKIFSAYLGLGVRRLMQQNKKQKKKKQLSKPLELPS